MHVVHGSRGLCRTRQAPRICLTRVYTRITVLSYSIGRGIPMPTSVRLDIKTEQLLTRLARRKRTTKSVVLREAVAVLARQVEQSEEKNADLYTKVEDLLGCVSGGPSDLSTRTGARFRQLLLEKKR